VIKATHPRRPPAYRRERPAQHGDPVRANPLYYDKPPDHPPSPEQDILRIDNQYGFHPSMAAIKPFWDGGKMAILTGIGYPNVDYSHFRSMDIWYTCEPETMATGRLAGQSPFARWTRRPRTSLTAGQLRDAGLPRVPSPSTAVPVGVGWPSLTPTDC